MNWTDVVDSRPHPMLCPSRGQRSSQGEKVATQSICEKKASGWKRKANKKNPSSSQKKKSLRKQKKFSCVAEATADVVAQDSPRVASATDLSPLQPATVDRSSSCRQPRRFLVSPDSETEEEPDGHNDSILDTCEGGHTDFAAPTKQVVDDVNAIHEKATPNTEGDHSYLAAPSKQVVDDVLATHEKATSETSPGFHRNPTGHGHYVPGSDTPAVASEFQDSEPQTPTSNADFGATQALASPPIRLPNFSEDLQSRDPALYELYRWATRYGAFTQSDCNPYELIAHRLAAGGDAMHEFRLPFPLPSCVEFGNNRPDLCSGEVDPQEQVLNSRSPIQPVSPGPVLNPSTLPRQEEVQVIANNVGASHPLATSPSGPGPSHVCPTVTSPARTSGTPSHHTSRSHSQVPNEDVQNSARQPDPNLDTLRRGGLRTAARNVRRNVPQAPSRRTQSGQAATIAQSIPDSQQNGATQLHGVQLPRPSFPRGKRVSEMDPDEHSHYSEYQKFKKRSQRARKIARAAGSAAGATIVEGAVTMIRRPRVFFFKGVPMGHFWSMLTNELSQIVRREVLCILEVDEVTDEQYERCHNMLIERYENGTDLDFKEWTKPAVNRLLLYRRTRSRKTTKEYNSHLPATSENPPLPPPGIFQAGYDFFTKQLMDPEFQAVSQRGHDMSMESMKIHGCGNNFGYGGVRRTAAHHTMRHGAPPTIEEVRSWKSEKHQSYQRRRGLDTSTSTSTSNRDIGGPRAGVGENQGTPGSTSNLQRDQGVNITGDGDSHQPTGPTWNADVQDMGPDWHHPFRGQLAFHQRHVLLFGREPTNEEIGAWYSSGRPALHPPQA